MMFDETNRINCNETFIVPVKATTTGGRKKYERKHDEPYNPFTHATVEYCKHDVEVTKRLLNDVYGYPIGLYTIENVIFNEPATIVFWNDGTKTVVKCQNNDVYSKETGLAMAICKKFFGNNGKYNDVFKKWIKG